MFDIDDDPTSFFLAPPEPRPPRRFGRVLSLERAIEAAIARHIGPADPTAPLPPAAVAAVNAVVVRAGHVLVRQPRRERPAPFAADRPLRPADAALVLRRLQDAATREGEGLFAARDNDGG